MNNCICFGTFCFHSVCWNYDRTREDIWELTEELKKHK